MRWLQFEGGFIRDVHFNFDSADFFIEHPEMPELGRGDLVRSVAPSYTTYQDNMGNKVGLREPLKGQ